MANRFKIETIFQGVDRISAPLGRIEQRVGRWSRNLSRRLRSVADTTDRWRRNLFRGLAAGGAAIGGALFLVQRQIGAFAKEADDLAKRSRRLGLPIEALQEWAFVAGQSGLETATFDKAIEGLSKRMGELRTGSGSLFSFLRRTDRQLLRTLSTTTDMGEAIDIMIDAIRRQPDPMMRAALATAAFGREGARFANIAELSAREIEQLREQMRQNGLITEEVAGNAEAYNDSLANLAASLRGLRNAALAPLLPMLTEAAENTREIVIANRELIAQNVVAFIQNVVTNFDDILDRTKQIAIAIGVFIVATSLIRTLAAAVTVLAGLIRGLTIAFGLFNLVVVQSPIGRTLAVIAAAVTFLISEVDRLIGRLQALRENFTMGGINDFLFPGIKSRRERMDRIQDRGFLRGFFDRGGSDDQAEAAEQSEGPSLIERITASRSDSTTTERSELVIRDETGRAEWVSPPGNRGSTKVYLPNMGGLR